MPVIYLLLRAKQLFRCTTTQHRVCYHKQTCIWVC